ncbi:MAG: bifunctional (p)ppGpp synthetase/guanosine-3',5'-bis(diphosphate) 3'-pyrophosphohydrolase [Firmicutes bacterium]|nr:bifunctional (p)ppGpp synthetase/guanosine-3',5'-bis(diphosphate) 3'-pyrophosphohydrolase [Bacillota bacterium]
MDSKKDFIERILSKNPNYNTEMIEKAYDIAEKLHKGQFRRSGEPYLIHPVNVAYILADMGMDEDTIIGGLLHDVVEDTDYTREDLIKDFNEEIANLVDGVTKLGNIKYESKEEIQAENFRKMFLAMSKDIRVLVIKLADRLHNMRTLEFMPPHKQQEKATETLEIYAPLAARLGIFTIKFELEDISLKYLHPKEYKDLVVQISQMKTKRETIINNVISEIKESLDDMGFTYEIYGRAKHYYSIYKKMMIQQKNLDEIFDLIAIRIIVDSVKDCYAVLGIVHTMWTPIPGRFKDYIAMPKPNMYQSIHTTVIGENGDPFEIQIRTREMHHVAEYGIAAHWKYKEGKNSGESSKDEIKLAWLRQSLELEKDSDDPKDFLENVKMDLFASQVFVFTPQSKVLELPNGSTPLDFAFKIHSEIGYKCVGAKVSGKMVPIDYVLQNGDIVEIVTSSNSSGPSMDWLNIAKSSNARNKIRAYLKRENKNENIEKGKDLVEKYLKKRNLEPSAFMKDSYIRKAVKDAKFATTEEAWIQLSTGGSLVSKFANLLIDYYQEDNKQEIPKTNEEVIDEIKAQEAKKNRTQRRGKDNPGIVVSGADNLMIKLAKCCNPVPGDEIVGFITKGRGISVHRCDCTNIVSLPEEEKVRFIDVEWEDLKEGKSYEANISIIGTDRRGLLSDISKVCENLDVNLSGVNARTGKDGSMNMTIQLDISSTQEMDRILRAFRGIEGISSVYRARS